MRSVIFIIFFISVTAGYSGAEPEHSKTNNPVCCIKTSMGDIFIELFQDQAPETVSNFIGLAEGTRTFTEPGTGNKQKRPFYDNLRFHRVIKDFMIQGGCPKGNGTGGPGYTFKDEINAVSLGLDKIKAIQPDGRPHPWLGIRSQKDFQRSIIRPVTIKLGIQNEKEFQEKKDEIRKTVSSLTMKDCYQNMGYQYNDRLKSSSPLRGVIAMANSGPGTNGSQFFINLVDTPWLAGKHTVFGKVIQGMDVVDKIGNTTVQNSRPQKDVKIISVRIVSRMKSDTQ